MRSTKQLTVLCLVGALVIGLGNVATSRAQSPEQAGETAIPTNEYLLKAAFLYNFAKLTRWPDASFEGPDTPLELCVLGKDPFGAALDALAGREAAGRRLVTRRIFYIEEAAGCHMVFVTGTWRPELARALESAADRPLLTVGDAQNFARVGGTISLKTVDDKVRFEINLGVARHSGLRLDVRLLQLADSVFTDQGAD